ncbi:MAG: hypothetical protein ABFD54_12535 [Armatimonadota bacterium]|nr:hypothetical protein [bacterium]
MTRWKLARAVGLLVLMVFVTTMAAPIAVLASTTGRRNTALGLTAGAVYLAVKGKKTAAIATGAGAAYAWKRHSDARKNQAYNRGLKKGYKHGYKRGYKNGKYRKGYYHSAGTYGHTKRTCRR